MKTDKLKITYINPFTKTIETQDYTNARPKETDEVQKDIQDYLESKFGEEILYQVSEAGS